MAMTAAQAAEAVGMTRQGIIKAIKTGKISAQKDNNGAWRVEPSELFRAYQPASTVASNDTAEVEPGIQVSSQGLQAEIEHLRALLERADQRADEWKAVAEREGQERRQLMALLTDQRTQEARRSIWARLLGR